MIQNKFIIFLWVGQCILVEFILSLFMHLQAKSSEIILIFLLSGLLLISYFLPLLIDCNCLKKVKLILSIVSSSVSLAFQAYLFFFNNWEERYFELTSIILSFTIICLLGDLIQLMKAIPKSKDLINLTEIFFKLFFGFARMVIFILFYVMKTQLSYIGISLSLGIIFFFFEILKIFFCFYQGHPSSKKYASTSVQIKKPYQRNSNQKIDNKSYENQHLICKTYRGRSSPLKNDNNLKFTETKSSRNYQQEINPSSLHIFQTESSPPAKKPNDPNNNSLTSSAFPITPINLNNKTMKCMNYKEIFTSPANKSVDLYQFLFDKLKFIGIGIFDNNKKLINNNIDFPDLIMLLLKNSGVLNIDYNVIIADWIHYFKQITLHSEVPNQKRIDSENDVIKNLSNELLDNMNSEQNLFDLPNSYEYFTCSKDKIYSVQILKTGEIHLFLTVIIIQEHASKIDVKNKNEELIKNIQICSFADITSCLYYLLSMISTLQNELPLGTYLAIKKSFKLIFLMIEGKLELISEVNQINNFKPISQYIFISQKVEKIISYLNPFYISLGSTLVFENFLDQAEDKFWWDKKHFKFIISEFLLYLLQIIKNGGVVVQLYYNDDDTESNNVGIRFCATGVCPNEKEQIINNKYLISSLNYLDEVPNCNSSLSVILLKMHTLQTNNFQMRIGLLLESYDENTIVYLLQFFEYDSSYSQNHLSQIELSNALNMKQVDSFLDESLVDSSWICLNQFKSMDNEPCICPFRILIITSVAFDYISCQITLNNLLKNSNQQLEFLRAENQEIGTQVFLHYFNHKKCSARNCTPIKVIIFSYNLETNSDNLINTIKKINSSNLADYIRIFVWANKRDFVHEEQFEKCDGILSKPLKPKNTLKILKKMFNNQVIFQNFFVKCLFIPKMSWKLQQSNNIICTLIQRYQLITHNLITRFMKTFDLWTRQSLI